MRLQATLSYKASFKYVNAVLQHNTDNKLTVAGNHGYGSDDSQEGYDCCVSCPETLQLQRNCRTEFKLLGNDLDSW